MAKTLLFIHGTGVRQASFAATLGLLQRQVARHLPGWTVDGRLWGDALGAQLNLQGASIPRYHTTQGNAAPALAAAAQARWVMLGGDPLFELRLAPEATVLGSSPGPKIWQAVGTLGQAAELQPVLSACGLVQAWQAFHAQVLADPSWQAVVSALPVKGAVANDKVARALVAGFQAELRHGALPGLTSARRDELVAAVLKALGGSGAGLLDWALHRLAAVAEPRRGQVSDLAGPAAGDVLRYQARGSTLRNFIADEVKRTGARVVLAHSLGGIATVDWLALTADAPVDKLITVGSQAPYLYEINALVSREFHEFNSPPPPFFTGSGRWLNLYDERDFLSYLAQPVFGDVATDVKVDSGQPFPESHSAYWHNDAEVWPAIKAFLG